MEKVLNKKQYLFLIPILLVLAVAPLIVYLKMVILDDTTIQHWTGNSKSTADIFSYYKAGLICISAVVMLFLCFLKSYRSGIKKKSMFLYYIPVAVYAVFVVLSAMFSKYPVTALNGFVDRYEGVLVLLAYTVILLFTMNMNYSEKRLKILSAGFFLSAALIGTIGIFQFFGFDYFRTYMGQFLMLPPKLQSLIGSLSFSQGTYSIYSTLYNANYVGTYMAMLFPISLVAFVSIKQVQYKVSAGIFSCLMFANLIGCRTITGYAGGIFALIFVLALLRKKILQNLKPVLAIAGCFIVIFIIMNAVSGGAILNGMPITAQNPANHMTGEMKKVDLQNIKLEGKSFSIVSKTETLKTNMDGDQYTFQDTDGNNLEFENKNDVITFVDKRYSSYILKLDTKKNVINVSAGTMKFSVNVQKDGFRFVGVRGELDNGIGQPEKVGFDGVEKLASSRGYNWSRSIPLLRKTVFIGNGPDTFALVFPQKDYIGKLRAFNNADVIVDKPFNFYLQTGINTGIVSLIAIIVLFGAYFFSSVRIYSRKEFNNVIEIAGIAAFVAFCGFAAAGVFNDSAVSVGPVFWAILGIGIACNYINSVKYAGELKQP
jgi:hypothetical protein